MSHSGARPCTSATDVAAGAAGRIWYYSRELGAAWMTTDEATRQSTARWESGEFNYEHPETAAFDTWSGRALASCPDHANSVHRVYDPYSENWETEATCERCGLVFSVAPVPIPDGEPRLLRSRDGLDPTRLGFRLQRMTARTINAPPTWTYVLAWAVLVVVVTSLATPVSRALGLAGLAGDVFGALIVAKGFFIEPARARRLSRTYYGRNSESARFFEGLWADAAYGFLLLFLGFTLQGVGLLVA